MCGTRAFGFINSPNCYKSPNWQFSEAEMSPLLFLPLFLLAKDSFMGRTWGFLRFH